ncbi:hypothetical protein L7F22_048818 [Adiantum nelumboides]|nr:hypothetical protein [Adiantum nelumboides]
MEHATTTAATAAAASCPPVFPFSESRISWRPLARDASASPHHCWATACKNGLLRTKQHVERHRAGVASHTPRALKGVSVSQTEDYTKYFDFVVIGSGIAGLRYALDVAKRGTVAIITKAEPDETNTSYAQGGVSAVLDPLDSVENHIRDTIVAGAYLCDEEAVEVVCREGPERVKELIAMGASFDQGEDGRLHLAREGGHSHHRIVHAADMTGREIERALLTSARNSPNIALFEHHFAIDFLVRQEGTVVTCHGVDTLDTMSGEVSSLHLLL